MGVAALYPSYENAKLHQLCSIDAVRMRLRRRVFSPIGKPVTQGSSCAAAFLDAYPVSQTNTLLRRDYPGNLPIPLEYAVIFLIDQRYLRFPFLDYGGFILDALHCKLLLVA
jgi:hypothetical protein